MITKVLTNIAIRVDASTRMGTGHVMRCLTLAKKLQQQNNQITFLCKRHKGNLISFIQQQGFTVIALSPPIEDIENQIDDKKWLGCTYQEDAKEVTKALAHYPWLDWLIVDHYSLDYRWEKLVKPLTNKIMVIDDLANRKHCCNILLDQTLNRQKTAYQELVPRYCNLLLGADFMLLRDEFYLFREKAKIKRAKTTQITKILISLGGTDPDNITEQLLHWLIQIKDRFPNLQLQVVVSPISNYLSQLKTLIISHHWIEIIVNPKSMAKLMFAADMAIGSSGATAWERCCLGLPSLTIISAKNQEKIAQSLSEQGASINLGNFNNLNVNKLIELLTHIIYEKNTYRNMVQQCFIGCDGLGALRVSNKIMSQNTYRSVPP